MLLITFLFFYQVQESPEFECNRCLQGYTDLDILISNQIGIGETITYLSGEQFCSQPSYVEQNLTLSCQEFLLELLPISLPKTGDQIVKYASELCQTLFEVCDGE